MSPSPPPNSGVSHLSVFVLTMITILCVIMIGATGVVKYRLDQSEIALAAPDVTFTTDQDNYDKTLRALGYGGFLEAAYRVITKHDRTALDDMKLHLKTAQGVLAHLNEKAPTGVRHDLQGLIDLYKTIYAKAEESLDNPSVAFTPADLAPALAALPFLDTRLQAAIAQNRLKAQDSYRFWGLSLTLIAWCSLLLAAAMSAGVYLVYRNRQAAPLRALAQSIQNLARGDMKTPVWGMHRGDAIGDLARAVDLARYHFSSLPDLSLMSDQGPVRLKFEGDTRSVFEALMRNIAGEFERTRRESSGYAINLGSLQESLARLANNLNAVINQLQVHDADSHQSLQQLVQRIKDTSLAFAQTQDHTVAQLNKLLPYLQERATKMAEVTSIAGSRVAQSLEEIIKAEEGLRVNAAHSQEIVEQFSSNTNQLSERLFASANLMQASGKLLGETTDTVQSRFNEAVETLGRGEMHLQEIMGRIEDRLGVTSKVEENMAGFAARAEDNLTRMESAIRNMATRHDQLSEHIVLATHRMEGVVAGFDSAQRAMGDAMQHVNRDGELLAGLLGELRHNNADLIDSISRNSQAGYTAVQGLAERSQKIMVQLEAQIAEQARNTNMRIGEMASNTHIMNKEVQNATSSLTKTIAAMRAEHDRFTTARTTFSDNIDRLGTRIEQQATSTIAKTEQWATQNFDKLASLTGNMEDLMQRMSILGQLTGTLGAVAGQLGQLVPALAQGSGARPAVAAFDDPPLETIAEELSAQLKGQWNEAMAHIEEMHTQLARIIQEQKDQLEMRLVVMDKKIRAMAEQGSPDPHQVELMNEILVMMSKIYNHIDTLDDAVPSQEDVRVLDAFH